MRAEQEFGINVAPDARDIGLAFRLARLVDSSGLDLVGVQDHPYQPSLLDTWTLISMLAARTERVRLFPNVADLPLRPPAMLAKAAASLDILSGGRIELGLGAGWMWDGIRAMGGPVRSPGEAVQALEEAIGVIRAFWGQEGPAGDLSSSDFRGEHYSLPLARSGPRPAHQMEIWIGALGPKMIELTGRLADGWSVSVFRTPEDRLPLLQHHLDTAAEAAGRDPKDVRRIFNFRGTITGGHFEPPTMGPAAYWIERLARFAEELGMDTFIFWPEGDDEGQVRAFVEDVVPGVRRVLGTPLGTP